MNTTLTLGIPAQSNLILVDNVTLQTVPATFTGQTISSDSPAATFAFDTVDPTLVVATPVSAGGGNILLSTTATYTDSTGAVVTNSFTASYPFTVVATADGLTLSLTDFVPVSSTTTSTTTA